MSGSMLLGLLGGYGVLQLLLLSILLLEVRRCNLLERESAVDPERLEYWRKRLEE